MDDSVSYEGMQQTLERVENNTMQDPLDKLDVAGEVRAVPQRGATVRLESTEALLNDLIAECHHAMRDVALRSAKQVGEADERQRFLTVAMEIATTGARIGEAIAKLRKAGAVIETRQRQIIEQVERVSPQTC